MMRGNGFTLIEVLVALAIFSIGIAGAMRAIGVVTNSTIELRNRQVADWIAQNRFAEIRAKNLFPPVGSNEGNVIQAGVTFHLQENIQTTPNPLFRRVDIRVSIAGNDHALTQLSGFAVQPLQ